jgi:PST family polysaccharide transporter
MVLARILSPSDYGLMGMVATATGFAALFRDLGLSTATIQKPHLDHKDVNDAFWVNATAGVGLAMIVGVLSPLIARFYGEQRLLVAMPVVGLAFVASGLSVQHSAILRRRLQFFRIGIAETSAAAISFVVSLVAALFGAGYWALIVGPLVLEAATCVLFWILCPWRPNRPGSLAGSGRLLHVGSHMLGVNILSYVSANLDRVIVGRSLGSISLGVFTRAGVLVMLPTQQLIAPISMVMLPLFSRLRDHPDRYRRVILSSVRMMVALTAPAVAILIACREWIVALLLGAKWMAVASVVPPLAVIAATQFIPNNLGLVLVVADRFRQLLVWNVLHLVAVAAAIGIGLRYGLLGVATGCAVVMTLFRVPGLFHMTGRASPASAASLWKVCVPFWLAAIGMGLFMGWLRGVLPGLGPASGLAVVGSLAGLLYVGSLALVPAGRDLMHDIRRVVCGFKGPAVRPGESVGEVV